MSLEKFIERHIGPREADITKMLGKIGLKTVDALIQQTIPSSILLTSDIDLPEGISEYEYNRHIREIAALNKIYKTFIGCGYYNTILPPVIMRNILENPAWYTSYTPYQAEISQGRLEALLNFQTMVIDLTGMEIANASLLDESTAAAEAMVMMYNMRSRDLVASNANKFFADSNIFPQTLDVLRTRVSPLDIELVIGDYKNFTPDAGFFGSLVQYPAADGSIVDYSDFAKKMHAKNIMIAACADIMSLVILVPPAAWGADIVFGSTQRFGIPMGFGGPHAAYFATKDEFKRVMPGRIIGVSVDKNGNNALRMSLQTREQHIKRERATSNICTAQALLANMAGMYAVYHGYNGLKNIALHIHYQTVLLASKIKELGYKIENDLFFDTLKITLPSNINVERIAEIALEREVNFNYTAEHSLSISLDETTLLDDLNLLNEIFSIAAKKKYIPFREIPHNIVIPSSLLRKDKILLQDVFNKYRSETEMMRYIKRLEMKDFSLAHSMIPLGSCTMKMNAAIEMMPLSWPDFGNIHPCVPLEQAEGYYEMINVLGKYLLKITGFSGVSFQPNSGAAGEYAGLLVIRQYHISRKEEHRNVVLIPSSAHGTNPASAAMAGMRIVVIPCEENGNINIDALKLEAEKHKNDLSCFMVTYPSTHGVFESNIQEMTAIIHNNGGLVYMDGANMNAQVGLTSPAKIGADVCHLNLHKTFAIPHGGGGPGMGPICVADKLVEFLPGHPLSATGGTKGITAVSAAPYGSASILTISYAYCKMLGAPGLRRVTEIAILSANYLAACLNEYFPVLYSNINGRVAHELIIDCRALKTQSGISETDIAKRLMDYGFHAPTLSFPVHGTLMIEPTESESLEELNRFVEAMISIHQEIMEVQNGKADREDNVLKNAPHTIDDVVSDDWAHSYTRQKAAYPLKWLHEKKFWPTVGRVNDAHGDRNLVCTCLPIDAYRREINSFELLK